MCEYIDTTIELEHFRNRSSNTMKQIKINICQMKDDGLNEIGGFSHVAMFSSKWTLYD